MSILVWSSALLSTDFFFFKQKTAYDMRISDWSSDVCSSDLATGSENHVPWRESAYRPARRPCAPARRRAAARVRGDDRDDPSRAVRCACADSDWRADRKSVV